MIDKELRPNKGNSLIEILGDFVVLDLETTGLDSQFDSIIEVSALRVKDRVVTERFTSLINPLVPINEFIRELTGIDDEMVKDAPTIEIILPRILQFIGTSVILGHNVNFDINFLYDACEACNLGYYVGNNFIDTMRMSRRLFKEERHHRLVDLIQRFGISDIVEHRAMADAEQTLKCYLYMIKYMEDHGINIEDIRPIKKRGSGIDISTIVVEKDTVIDPTSPVFEKTFVFTGKLEKFKREQAMQKVVNRGGYICNSVTKKTNYLVIGSNEYCTTIKEGKSLKQKKAEELIKEGQDLSIITEGVFLSLITEQ